MAYIVILAALSVQMLVAFPEPQCSNYDFQEKLLEKTVRMELHIELLEKENKELKNQQLLTQNNYNADLAALNARLGEIEAQILANSLNTEKRIADAADTLTERYTNGYCTTNKIIFRAKLSKQSLPLTTQQIVVFDTVQENVGNAYNAYSGVFTSQLNGTYVFQFAIGNPTGKPGVMFLKKNSEVIDYAIAGHTSGWNIAGKTAFLYLEVADTVYVVGEGHVAGTYGTDRHHSSFSGVLMHAC
ncbi:C1q-related factor-like [Mya arenaria]|uniref:C1q-related factor-like n=1 Tax=Mya arenaria TaxID=6604 RepID=UPI0022E4365D|nr:C1q-related factor-like [Mya arenaria]